MRLIRYMTIGDNFGLCWCRFLVICRRCRCRRCRRWCRRIRLCFRLMRDRLDWGGRFRMRWCTAWSIYMRIVCRITVFWMRIIRFSWYCSSCRLIIHFVCRLFFRCWYWFSFGFHVRFCVINYFAWRWFGDRCRSRSRCCYCNTYACCRRYHWKKNNFKINAAVPTRTLEQNRKWNCNVPGTSFAPLPKLGQSPTFEKSLA